MSVIADVWWEHHKAVETRRRRAEVRVQSLAGMTADARIRVRQILRDAEAARVAAVARWHDTDAMCARRRAELDAAVRRAR
jgi:hypothetical protein